MKLYTVKQLAKEWGKTDRGIYTLISTNQLKYFRFGRGKRGELRFSQQQVDEFLKTAEGRSA